MQTPWGEFSVRDAHAHLFTRRFFESMARLSPPGRLAEPDRLASLTNELALEVPAERGGAARQWQCEMERYGITSSVLIGSIPGEQDEVAEAVESLAGRCIGYAMVDPTQPGCPDLIRRMGRMGLRGVALFPAMHSYHISDEFVRPALDAVRDSGLVALVHFGLLRLGLRERLGISSPFDLRYANPIDLHAVALRYPEITFQIPHFGCGFFREALLLGAQVSNVVLDTSSSNAWVRMQAPTLSLKEVFARALDVYGPRRVLFGTDSSTFPPGWRRDVFETQVLLLRELGLSATDAADILGNNLGRLVKMLPQTE